jgi:hypothetical protein
MTRAGQRMLDRARASAWRRVGIPTVWSDSPATPRSETIGKNVAATTSTDLGTGRPPTRRSDVNHDSTEE